ncbi:competence protein CoiA family protein [Paenibacillus larvae]
MIKAIAEDGNAKFAWEAERGPKYICPGCEGRVVLKRGEVKVAHFAHYPGDSCPYSIGESWEHMRMKENMIKILRKRYASDMIDSEVAVIDGRRADIVLKLPDFPLVIECQVSPISVAEVRERTQDYLKAGCFVQWVFHLSRLKRDGFYERVGAVRIPEEIRFLETKTLPLYFMDDDGRIRSCELKYKWAKGSATYTKTTCFCNFKKVRLQQFVLMFTKYDI